MIGTALFTLTLFGGIYPEAPISNTFPFRVAHWCHLGVANDYQPICDHRTVLLINVTQTYPCRFMRFVVCRVCWYQGS